jgi:hypothetical protein
MLLRDAVHAALSAATKPTFEAKTKGKTAKQTFDEVWKRLDRFTMLWRATSGKRMSKQS